MTETRPPIQLVCPIAQCSLTHVDATTQHCPTHAVTYQQIDGVWRMLPPERQAYFADFIADYETVRSGEARGSNDPNYYRQLPHQDISGQRTAEWAQRNTSFRILMDAIVYKLEQDRERTLNILDLGAGSGWVSYNLSLLGHQCAAVDLCLNSTDGLGAHVHYDAPFLPVQAEFDSLPFEDAQFDLVIFNAAFHYSENYQTTLSEGLRVRLPEGALVIMDTPVYTDAASGQQMVAERQQDFARRFGTASDSIAAENYLTEARLSELETSFNIEWERYSYVSNFRQKVRRFKTGLMGKREAPNFPLLTIANFEKETMREYRKRILGGDID